MPPTIDQTSYPKTNVYPLRHGYYTRAAAPTSLVIHTTNNDDPTSFAHEAKYLFESARVSADFLIGKDGRIVQFLDSARFYAWHAGTALPAFINAKSIGIECHHSVGDGPWPVAQEAALTWLVRLLMARFTIPPSLIETHRAVALPAGRKHDPNDWSDRDFSVWRAALVSFSYRVLHTQAVFEAPRPDGKVALGGTAEIPRGGTVVVNEVKAGWAHLTNGIGFVPVGILERL